MLHTAWRFLADYLERVKTLCLVVCIYLKVFEACNKGHEIGYCDYTEDNSKSE